MSVEFESIRASLPVLSKAQGKLHMEAVAEMECVICERNLVRQASRTTVHHCIHGRGGNLRAPDNMTIPLCEGCHQGLLDASKTPLHKKPGAWMRSYGLDTDYLSQVFDAVGDGT